MSIWQVHWHMMRNMQQKLPNPVRLKTDTLAKLTNLMLGAAWAIVLIGMISAFTSFIKINLFAAVLSAFIGAFPGLLIVLFLEYLMLKSEKLKEMQKQTAYLKEILEKMKTSS